MLLPHPPEGLLVELRRKHLPKTVRIAQRIAGQALEQTAFGDEFAGAERGVAGLELFVVVGPEKRERRGERAGRDARDHVERRPGSQFGPAAEEARAVRTVLTPAGDRKHLDRGLVEAARPHLIGEEPHAASAIGRIGIGLVLARDPPGLHARRRRVPDVLPGDGIPGRRGAADGENGDEQRG